VPKDKLQNFLVQTIRKSQQMPPPT